MPGHLGLAHDQLTVHSWMESTVIGICVFLLDHIATRCTRNDAARVEALASVGCGVGNRVLVFPHNCIPDIDCQTRRNVVHPAHGDCMRARFCGRALLSWCFCVVLCVVFVFLFVCV